MKKLFLCYNGPFVITQVNDNNTMVLSHRDVNLKRVYNINQLKPYRTQKSHE